MVKTMIEKSSMNRNSMSHWVWMEETVSSITTRTLTIIRADIAILNCLLARWSPSSSITENIYCFTDWMVGI